MKKTKIFLPKKLAQQRTILNGVNTSHKIFKTEILKTAKHHSHGVTLEQTNLVSIIRRIVREKVQRLVVPVDLKSTVSKHHLKKSAVSTKLSIFVGARKCNLKILAEELEEKGDDSHNLKDLKKIILASKEYDEECSKEWLNTIINERKENEEIEERKRQEEIAERKRQEVIAERKHQEEFKWWYVGEEKNKNTMNGSERMKWNLSCKKYVLEQKSKLNSPDVLFEKLDDYDILRSTFRSKQPRKEWHYDKQNSFRDDSAVTINEKRKMYGITHNERGEPKCFNCSNFGYMSLPKTVLTCRECNETGHKDINCVAKESNHSSDESLSVRRVGENSDERCPALTSIGRIKADIEVDDVKGESISIYVVLDDAQSVDLSIGLTWLDIPRIAYTKIGKRFHIGCREDEPFRNFPIDEKVNRVCLKPLETAQLEKESLQIKNFSHEKMIGNLANDLKIVKNEIILVKGDIKNFKEERHSLLLQIQEKNKNVENLKNDNDSLVKTNAYYYKKKTGESTKTQQRYRGPMVVTEILPSDTYRISQLEPSNCRLYATTAQVSQLKAWRSWNEDDDSSENFDEEPGMQRPKRTVRRPVRY
ncbi:hypothetical protein AVEN_79531-1 [Araneus ventricosus]|uniref:CCHC-type domain-containing protein n=1 Tax=Araneus ventricosus TaxID=182803 RepID=A0A4Y2NAV0_ARAVE|nr:hypothetical protein AVEN_79531-1 [Araneus ventricosus]